MSNLIKSRYVYLNNNDKKIIDSNKKVVEIKNIQQTLVQLESSDESETSQDCVEEAVFTEGIQATVLTSEASEIDLSLIQEQADQILAEAKEQADQIIQQAEYEAKIASQKIFDEANQKGYEDGIRKAAIEINDKKKELTDFIQKQREDYQLQVENLEPQFVNIVAKLVEKITGVVIEDKKEIILYLIHSAIDNADSSKSYVIKTSAEDYDYISSMKDELIDCIKNEAILDIAIDMTLCKNQALIETDTRIIDCSLDVQLSNLIQDLKLLSLKKE